MHGPGTDEPLVWYEGSGTSDRRFLHADERGSIVAVSNGSGTVTSVNTYDEYGKPGSGNVGRFQYTGQKWIAELGLYDYKARMYHPALPRFMQTDPIGYGDGMNMYNAMGGDPVNSTDPTGLELTNSNDLPDQQCYGSRIIGCTMGSVATMSFGQSWMFNSFQGTGAAGSSPVYVPEGSYRCVRSCNVPTKTAYYKGEETIVVTGGRYEWVSSYPSPAARSPWATGDFIDHYFSGNGRTVNLHDIGLDRFFEKDATVAKATDAYISLVTSVRVEEFHLNRRQIGVSDLTNCLFALGNSAIYGESWCRYRLCFFRFSIHDAFRDPLDLGFEIPGGTPYDIVHEWRVFARRRGGW